MVKLYIILGLCIITLFQDVAESKPSRSKRFVGDETDDDLGSDSLSEDYLDSNDLETQDNRDARDASTFPPYPDHAQWWWFSTESDEDILVTEEPPVTEEYYPETGTTESGGDANTFNFNEIQAHAERARERFHKKVVPWFKKQWGHTRNFFQRQYDNAANALG